MTDDECMGGACLQHNPEAIAAYIKQCENELELTRQKIKDIEDEIRERKALLKELGGK